MMQQIYQQHVDSKNWEESLPHFLSKNEAGGSVDGSENAGYQDH
ncbi:MAG TPA: hypothetical protein VN875_21470 [Candidatus Binatus sp.]|nr:hypothetical protein [Candidatus Binatus sp.]